MKKAVCKEATRITRKLRKNFVVIKFGNSYVLSTPLLFDGGKLYKRR